MRSSLMVDVLRDQLLEVMQWHQIPRPSFQWGVVIHRRNERGRLRFGVITPSGESLLLSGPMLDELRGLPCWLDGTVPVRLETRKLSNADALLDAASRGNRPQLVEAMAVYFDPESPSNEPQSFKQMAGVLTPATIPAELFVLTRQRPASWPL